MSDNTYGKMNIEKDNQLNHKEIIKFFDLDQLAQIQDDFSVLFSAGTMLLDVDLNPIIPASNLPEVCSLFHRLQSDAEAAVCESEDRSIYREALTSGEVMVKRCRVTGMTRAAIPLTVNGVDIGCWIVFGSCYGCSEENFLINCEMLPVDKIAALDAIMRSSDNIEDDFAKAVKLLTTWSKSICERAYAEYKLSREMERSEYSRGLIQKNYDSQTLVINVMNTVFGQSSMEDAVYFIIDYISEYMKVENAFIAVEGTTEDTDIFIQVFKSKFRITEAFLRERFLHLNKNYQALAKETEVYLIANGLDHRIVPITVSSKWIGFICLANESDNKYIIDESYSSAMTSVATAMANIHIRKSTEEQVYRANRTSEIILNSSNLLIYAIDAETNKIVYVNDSIAGILHDKNVMGKLASEVFPYGLASDMECLKKLSDGENEYVAKEYYNETLGLWVHSTITSCTWLNSRETILEIAIDATAEKEKDLTIQNLIWLNKLTGLPGRIKMVSDLEAVVENEPFAALLHLNIDSFRRVNDAYSHEFGDFLLIEVSRFFTSIEDSHNKVYHFGGDEFVFLVTSSDDVSITLDKINRRFGRAWLITDIEHFCTISCGVATYPSDADNHELLLKYSATALSKAKEKGADNLVLFADLDDDKLIEIMRLERHLARTVMDHMSHFIAYFQPIVSGLTGKIVGMEALARWFDPELGSIQPNQFIAAAERLNLIGAIDQEIMRQGCLFVQELHALGYPELTVNVNSSVVQIFQDDYLEKITNILYQTGLEAKYLTLEVTESVAITDMDYAMTLFAQMRSMGITLALDDFGTGYSSLTALKDMPMDKIKIDRSFISDVNEIKFNHTFVSVITEIAHIAQMMVCCEGVETAEQWETLRNQNADLMQGYFFGKPLPKEQFIELLKQNHELYGASEREISC